ncbi:MAG: LolA-like putative outer membrane lipoprotein chaperone, partial [Bacteroidales bacterium]
MKNNNYNSFPSAVAEIPTTFKTGHKREIMLILTWILTAMTAFGQTGRCNTLMKNVAERYNKSDGISINFTITTKSADKTISRTAGNIKLKGDKFAISTPEIESWYNGKNSWSYLKSNNEVNITQPDEDEITKINPYILLRDYKKRFVCSYGGKQENLETVILKPINEGDEIKSAKITINGKHLYPTRIEVVNREGLKSIVIITNYRSEMNFDN